MSSCADQSCMLFTTRPVVHDSTTYRAIKPVTGAAQMSCSSAAASRRSPSAALLSKTRMRYTTRSLTSIYSSFKPYLAIKSASSARSRRCDAAPTSAAAGRHHDVMAADAREASIPKGARRRARRSRTSPSCAATHALRAAICTVCARCSPSLVRFVLAFL